MDHQQFRQLHNDLDFIAMQLSKLTTALTTLTALADPLRTLATVQARVSPDTQ